MTDIHSKKVRSFNMSRVKGKETSPEVFVRKYLFGQGLRFRKNVRDLPGKPDIVLPKYRTVIFVNGCFWHGHQNCKKAKLPATRTDWWKEKIQKNIERDSKNIEKLARMGWQVLLVWECELKRKDSPILLGEILSKIKNHIDR